MSGITDLVEQLSDLDKTKRMGALDSLATLDKSIILSELDIPAPQGLVNLHAHSFFSYNAKGWSPARIAWEMLKLGVEYLGIVEFDVLDHLEEALEAGMRFNIKTIAGLETRTFVPELSNVEINSPGEKGISYAMAHAITALPDMRSLPYYALENFHVMAQQRNKTVMERVKMAQHRNKTVMEKVNEYLGDSAALDYKRDVLSMTPSGNATERHLAEAYVRKAARTIGEGDKNGQAKYWADKLHLTLPKTLQILTDTPEELPVLIRSKLMKQGGPGYVTPEPKTFPTLADFFAWAKKIGGVPTATWLNGESEGEKDAGALLDLYMALGAQALNIIPDRNYSHQPSPLWPKDDKKYENLKKIIQAAQDRRLPISFGTELNSFGQPVVDNWGSAALGPYRGVALDGAKFFYAHTHKG